jgi:hypothetical protein
MQTSPRKSYLVKFPVCKLCGNDIAWGCPNCGKDYCRDCTVLVGDQCIHRLQSNPILSEVEDV